MKLDFVCIGAQKAGTTTLHNILKTHPEIYLPQEKEAEFFDINEYYEKGLDHYFSTFYNTYRGEKIVGNINPNLHIETRSIDRIVECFGQDIKCIFILRDPVKRAYSHYLMSKKRGYENLAFWDALKEEPSRIQNPKKHPHYFSQEPGHYEKNHLGYVSRSCYRKTISFLLEKFPKENIKLILFEDLIEKKKETTQEILDFLGIQNSPYLQYDIKSNVASKPRNIILRDFIYQPNSFKKKIGSFMNQKRRAKLKRMLDTLNTKHLTEDQKRLMPTEKNRVFRTYFENEVEEIEQLTGLDLCQWKK